MHNASLSSYPTLPSIRPRTHKNMHILSPKVPIIILAHRLIRRRLTTVIIDELAVRASMEHERTELAGTELSNCDGDAGPFGGADIDVGGTVLVLTFVDVDAGSEPTFSKWRGLGDLLV
jgi:hypothetical protein